MVFLFLKFGSYTYHVISAYYRVLSRRAISACYISLRAISVYTSRRECTFAVHHFFTVCWNVDWSVKLNIDFDKWMLVATPDAINSFYNHSTLKAKTIVRLTGRWSFQCIGRPCVQFVLLVSIYLYLYEKRDKTHLLSQNSIYSLFFFNLECMILLIIKFVIKFVIHLYVHLEFCLSTF